MSEQPRRTGVDTEVPVLIAGGGLIGLSAAMFLAQHRIRSLAIERLAHGSPLPRAGHFHLRTIELFRSAGIEDEVRAQSERDFVPEGAIIAMDSLAGRKLADIIPGLNVGVDDTLTPIRRMFINQPSLERILRRRAAEVGATLRTGCELVDFEQDEDGVTATVRDTETGADSRVRARYLIGADGAHSKVRELLGIPLDGRGIFAHSMTIYFHANVWSLIGDKPLSVIYINNSVFGGFFRFAKDCQSGFLGVNTVGDPKSDPVKAANAAVDTGEARLIEIVRSGIGVPDLPVTIDGCTRWRSTSDVAQRFQDRRVFLVGDAAHLMPPNGGFGGNTGIHDAHNLAWKIAMVLSGVATSRLLDSYEAERKPAARFTVEQAYTRYVTRTAPYLGARDYEPLVHDFNIELGVVYRSRAMVTDDDDDKSHDDPRQARGRPGSRAPHVWVQAIGHGAAARRSTLDLFGRRMVLLAGPAGAEWGAAAKWAAGAFAGLELDTHLVGGPAWADPDGRFCDAYGVESDGACLMRPDGIVAWRAKAGRPDREAAMAHALGAVLGRDG
jgi:2-polyprenyl-6-methoxyphenol hydroxylase-like FAD-dependent oxidoreductase